MWERVGSCTEENRIHQNRRKVQYIDITFINMLNTKPNIFQEIKSAVEIQSVAVCLNIKTGTT